MSFLCLDFFSRIILFKKLTHWKSAKAEIECLTSFARVNKTALLRWSNFVASPLPYPTFTSHRRDIALSVNLLQYTMLTNILWSPKPNFWLRPWLLHPYVSYCYCLFVFCFSALWPITRLIAISSAHSITSSATRLTPGDTALSVFLRRCDWQFPQHQRTMLLYRSAELGKHDTLN